MHHLVVVLQAWLMHPCVKLQWSTGWLGPPTNIVTFVQRTQVMLTDVQCSAHVMMRPACHAAAHLKEGHGWMRLRENSPGVGQASMADHEPQTACGIPSVVVLLKVCLV